MERTQIYMHDHLPEFTAMLTVLFILAIKNTQHLLSILSDHTVLLQISMAQTAEVFFYGFIGGGAGWIVKYAMDHHGKPFIQQFIKPKK